MLHIKTSLILFMGVYIVQCAKNNCKLSNLDSVMKPLTKIIADKNSKWPETAEQKHEFCRYKYQRVHRAKDHVRQCYHGLSASLLRFSVDGIEKMNVKMSCKSDAEMERFLSRSKCGNSGKVGTAKCYTSWTHRLALVRNVTDDAKRVSIDDWIKCSHGVYLITIAPLTVGPFGNYYPSLVVTLLVVVIRVTTQHIFPQY
ncbi:unnamed protein product [Medioppia subpectinata]|uniref:Uncharacterized protein n=1 Tax=Medioppia subpectinata TaxID=1979941 RepID=A0A7R9Q825_9ACAR|nr:unnamed protein product [Medioppia subpectinata]CAG2116207.1 unnamed protein product [Medioppia subpectinata]